MRASAPSRLCCISSSGPSAVALGLVRVLDVEGARVTGEMVAALQRLALQRRPSTAAVPGLLAGLDTINRRLRPWLSHGEADPATAAVTA